MQKIKILVVDDEEVLCTMIEKSLEEDYQVVTAYTGKEALKLFAEEKPKLILLDIILPKMDGITILRRIRKMDKNIPVIAMTAYASTENRKKIDKLKVSSWLLKPFNIVNLKSQIDCALNLENNDETKEG